MANMFEFELSAFEYRHIANAVEFAADELVENEWMSEADKRKRREAVTALRNLLIIFDGREGDSNV